MDKILKIQIKSAWLLSLCLVLFISCSTTSNFSRIPAASTESCAEIASLIINKNIIEEGVDFPKAMAITSIDSIIAREDSLGTILNSRKKLREKYFNVKESIRDFEIKPDTPIRGTTKLVLDPREGYLAKIMMIRNAKKTIDLSYYIFNNDDTGKAILHEIRLAIKRGVHVRVLVDSSGSVSKAPFYNDIKALTYLSGRPVLDEFGNPTGELAKVEAVLFNPIFNIRAHVANWLKATYNLFVSESEKLPLATFTINRRSHDKILMIDAQSPTDSIAMIGGRNITDHYYNVGKGENNPMLDAEILIKGLAHRKADGTIHNVLEDHYNKIYYYLANKNFSDFLFQASVPRIKKEVRKMRESAAKLIGEDGVLDSQLKAMEADGFLEKDFEDGLISILNEIQNLSRTKIFFQPHGPHNKINGNSFVSKLHSLVQKAEKSVDIVSPYFWIPDDEIDFMIEWAAKDPSRKIRVFTNSIATTDNLVAQSMVDATFSEKILKRVKGTPLEGQVEIYSYGRIDDELMEGNKKYGHIHAKIAVVDGKSMTISTSNLDPISRHLNSEVGTSIEELPVGSKNMARLQEYIENLKTNSTLWGSDEWMEIRKHPKNRIMILVQAFITKIIYALNLIPII